MCNNTVIIQISTVLHNLLGCAVFTFIISYHIDLDQTDHKREGFQSCSCFGMNLNLSGRLANKTRLLKLYTHEPCGQH